LAIVPSVLLGRAGRCVARRGDNNLFTQIGLVVLVRAGDEGMQS